MKVDIKRVVINDQIENKLIALSNVWAKENNCYGLVPNTKDEFKDKIIYIAYIKDDIVGYLFGHTYEHDKKVSAIEHGSNVFEVDELYVEKLQRSKGIGKALFKYAEKDLLNDVDYFTLSTSNMNRHRIMHFYIEELGMSFWSARFYKKVE